MADITLSYKGSTIATLSASGSKTIQTAGKYCEGDIGLAYVKSPGQTPGDPVTYYKNYLRSSGTQYIDTGYRLPANQDGMRIEVLCKLLTRTLNAGTGSLFGVNGLAYLITTNDQNDAYFNSVWNNDISGHAWTHAPNYYADNTKHILVMQNSKSCWRNGLCDASDVPLSHTYTPVITNDTLYVFAWNRGGHPFLYSYCAMDLYNIKVYEQDRLAVDIVPALDENNVPCAYDNVRGIYLYNQGTGDFVFGTDS